LHLFVFKHWLGVSISNFRLKLLRTQFTVFISEIPLTIPAFKTQEYFPQYPKKKYILDKNCSLNKNAIFIKYIKQKYLLALFEPGYSWNFVQKWNIDFSTKVPHTTIERVCTGFISAFHSIEFSDSSKWPNKFKKYLLNFNYNRAQKVLTYIFAL
jgi:hypothetical protein